MKLENRILNLLDKNAKLTAEEISVMLGEDKKLVADTIKEMEDKKIILGYKTLINWEKVNDDRVTAYIELNVIPEEGRGFEKVAEEIITQCPQVKSITLMSGGYDFMIKIDGSNMKDIALFVAERISPLNCIKATKTHFVLRRYKQEGIVLSEKNKDERSVITL